MKRKSSILIVIGLLLIASALSLVIFNHYQDYSVDKQNKILLEVIEEKQIEDHTALYRQYPDVPMPVIEVEDLSYVGTIIAPSVDLNTPILASYDAKTMEVTPALYSGTAYKHDMLLLGHNYQSCFGKLAYLNIGDEIQFIDNHKNQFYYEVNNIFIAGEYEFDRIQSREDDWDLTMFTCTWSGKERVVIRCTLIKDVPAMMNQE